MKNSNPKIYFRADASPAIGLGHFIRTLALVDILKDDYNCIFVTQTPTVYQKQEVLRLCSLIELPSTDEKFDLFLDLLQEHEIVVLDNYFFTTDYQKAIKAKGCKLICIDDMHNKHYVADAVINCGLNDASLFEAEPYTELCLGFEWALLRNPFLNAIPKSNREKGHCAISFGGTDTLNLTLKVARILQESQSIKKITAIVGDMYTYTESLKEISKIDIKQNITANEIADIFCSVEFAILPTSTISLEALACNCPVIAGYFTDNQIPTYNNYKRIKNVSFVNDFSEITPNIIHNGIKQAKSSTFDKSKIIQNYKELFFTLSAAVKNYTELSLDEHKSLLDIRNNIQIRSLMKSTEYITIKDHLKFIDKLKEDTTKRYFAVFLNDVFFGGFSFVDICNDKANIGIFLNPIYINSGKGILLKNIAEKTAKDLNIKTLVAEIFSSNQISLQFHKKNGYHEIDLIDNIYLFEKELH